MKVIGFLRDWFTRRRNPYRVELRELCAERIEIDEFRRRCMATWIRNNGPVPEGRALVVGVSNGSLLVGHTERIPEYELGGSVWKFKKLAGAGPGGDTTKLKPFRRTPIGTVTLSKSDHDVMQRDAELERDEIRKLK